MLNGFDYLFIVFMAISVIFLLLSLKTNKKREFLISIFFIFVGSIINYINHQFSVVLIFVLAIFISFIGDLLMAQVIKITSHRTVDGVMAFGIAHLLYIYGLYTIFYQTISGWFYVIWIILSIILFYFIGYNKRLPTSIMASNFIYALIITALFSLVLIFAFQPYIEITFKIVSLLGVILFLISDGVLAYNEFQKPIKYATEIIAITYVLAQVLLQMIPFLSNILT